MTLPNAHQATPRTLADALREAQGRINEHASDPLVDRLATALVLPQAASGPADFDDDDDDDLDLPMLVQANRGGAIVPLPPIQSRGREGRAALIGFGLGMILLVPLGVVMSNRLPEPFAIQAESSASALLQAVRPTTVVTDETGIRTTRRATQDLPPAALAALEEPAPAPPAAVPPPVTEFKAAAMVAPAIVAPAPAAAPAPLPAPDHLAEAIVLIGQGDLAGARARIQEAGLDTNPQAVLALAETFDPNMLAAWSIRGAHADADRARLLYARALAQGVTKARQRLDALE